MLRFSEKQARLERCGGGTLDDLVLSLIGQTPELNLKLVRKAGRPYSTEVHGHDEALLVVDGQINLLINVDILNVEVCELCVVRAGTPMRLSRTTSDPSQ
jgi:mannose-6-phosphate isomerase-like protein (cupin superfamily)